MIKKKINFLSIVFLLSFFLPTTLFSVESFEDDAKNKRLGLEHKERDSEHIIREKLIRNIELGNLDQIEVYVKDHGKNINFIVNNLNPFVHAASVNNYEIVKFFLKELEIEINVEDGLGNTALLEACGKGYIELVNFLINNEADVNYQNKQGTTPAMKAAENNQFHILQLLLEQKNIDKSRSDYTGRTLREIAENSRDKRLLKLLN